MRSDSVHTMPATFNQLATLGMVLNSARCISLVLYVMDIHLQAHRLGTPSPLWGMVDSN